MGYLNLYMGCMYAGKTRLLITKLSKCHDLRLKVVYVTHLDDKRVSEGLNGSITTHWSAFSKADVNFDCLVTSDLSNLYPHLLAYDVIGIDEYQFFPQSSCEVVRKLVDLDDKIIHCVGLDGNFKRERFGFILDLIPIADKIKKISAKCELCMRNNTKRMDLVSAPFTLKIGGDPGKEKEIGTTNLYMSLCRHHYITKTHLKVGQLD